MYERIRAGKKQAMLQVWVPPKLIKETEAAAKRHNLTRPDLIRRLLEGVATGEIELAAEDIANDHR